MGLNFLETNAGVLFARFRSLFEAASGRVLYPAQVENLLLKVLAYVDSERRMATQYAAEQNLVEYAAGPHLDALGANLETPRLAPRPAECEAEFRLALPSPAGASFAAATRIATADSKIVFETIAPAYVLSGRSVSSRVTARCTVPGAHANALAAGTLCCLDPSTPGATAASVTATYGGGDTETDAAYRARLLLAPARHGGGTADGYRLAALSTSPDVIDALAVRHIGRAGSAPDGIGRAGSAPDGEPSPDAPSGADTGNILLYVMAKDGIEASQGLCAMVEARCNRSDVRLIGDWITAVPASTVPYTISAAVTLRHGNDAAEILDKARALAHAFGATHNTALGADVTPTQITLALAPLADAIYTIDLQRPAATIEIGKSEWAKLEGVEITLAGVVDE